jgi:hypothetical protein
LQILAVFLHQGVYVYILYRNLKPVVSIVAAPPGGLPHMNPIGGLIAGSAKAVRLYISLKEINLMAIFAFPITGDLPTNATQNVTGKTFYLNPRQNQISHVIGHKVDIELTGLGIPTNKFIAARYFPRG